ncbi:MAG: aminotransferase class I/II-fold pyridoxal phosphate-dependent enzyme [Moorellales bacterium]
MFSYHGWLKEQYRLDENLIDLGLEVEREIRPVFAELEEVARVNHARVLHAFLEAGIADYHFAGSTGYGYGDLGRNALEEVFGRVFGAEAALVRTAIASGTHALALCFYGALRPGDELLVVGDIYPTLRGLVGLNGASSGGLGEWGIECRQVSLDSEPEQVLRPNTKAVFLQRSAGYGRGSSLGIPVLAELISRYKRAAPDIVCIVDNCYGEFVEMLEPSHVEADLVAGSLIKNPGGGLVPAGGYVVGRRPLVEQAAARLTAPGLGALVGAEPQGYRLFFQGLYLAPLMVAEALKTAVFAARLFERLGFEVFPRYNAPRTDIVQAVELGSPQRLLAFCRGLQRASAVDSRAVPEPSYLPGYQGEVLMAAGTFVQGASLELSADAPWDPPYTVYLQGGLSYYYGQIGVLSAAQELLRANLLPERLQQDITSR